MQNRIQPITQPITQTTHTPPLKHLAIIMDGNGRWAKKQHKPRIFGHKNGVKAVRIAVEKSAQLGLQSLTLFAFSSENIHRPKLEVDLLFSLFLTALKSEVKKLATHNIRLKFIGDMSIFPEKIQHLATQAVADLSHNTGLELIIAANYGGKWDITQAANAAMHSTMKNNSPEITPQDITDNLSIDYDIDLVIRTSGEQRISNFLLWQCAYSEFYFTDVLWPDFDEIEFDKAIAEFEHRQRRFGK
jgi:undecaprenyl diphosphate synthase